VDIRFLGHACFELTEGDTRVLVDPFLSGNPKAAAEASELEPTHIFLTHGHQDHYGDIVDIGKRTGAQIVANTELAGELSGQQGLENVADPNIGGTVEFDDCWVRLTPAWHTATSPNGTVHTPAGLVINLGGKTVYHVGDTGLFSDIRLAGERDQLDAALVCIGGHYTMDRGDAAADRDGRSGVQVRRGGADGRQDHRRGARAGRDVQPLDLVLHATGEPHGAVLPVVRDEERPKGRQDDPGGAVVDALAADPYAPPRQVNSHEPITVCPRSPHCVTPH
jgi:glyoxylase-like metal-dependent hydrolase (beta-lactamase superfamily II)